MSKQYLSVDEIAVLVGLQPWQIRRLEDRGFISPPRVARTRVFTPGDVPTLREAAVRAGYPLRPRLPLSALDHGPVS